MFTKAGFYTFLYGTRIGDADAPPFLKFRSSSSFIIATIIIAVFTVRISNSLNLEIKLMRVRMSSSTPL
jgi:hypothetical protein